MSIETTKEEIVDIINEYVKINNKPYIDYNRREYDNAVVTISKQNIRVDVVQEYASKMEVLKIKSKIDKAFRKISIKLKVEYKEHYYSKDGDMHFLVIEDSFDFNTTKLGKYADLL